MIKKRIIRTMTVIASTVVLLATGIFCQEQFVNIDEDEVPLGSFTSAVVTQTEQDVHVIPDKYNTGATGQLEKVSLGGVVGGIQLKGDGSGTKNIIDFVRRNTKIKGDITIENKDFSRYDLAVYSEDDVKRKITITFRNCSFAKIAKGKSDSMVSFKFENCTLNNFNGSNATFSNCFIGHSYSDGMVPYQNVELNNCFFADLVDKNCKGSGYHTDGTQLYGYKGVDVKNVSYNNCRFEVPAISGGSGSAAVNSCLMMQLEYSNGKNISIKNCIMNGGGYTIFARSVNKKFSLNNVVLDDVRIGSARTFGFFYTDISPDVEIRNVRENSGLYVASVWKKNKKTHFSVTNDTDIERKLLIYTDKGEYSYVIPACPTAKKLEAVRSYEEMPFDIDIVIPKNCKYAVCYDATVEGAYNQIRFVNWSTGKVVLSDEFLNRINNHRGEIVASGKCGKQVTYKLDNEGVLTLEGSGSTDDYHSQKITPWAEKNLKIRKLVVKKGVKRLGNQLFNGTESLSEVVLADGVVEIGSRTFAKCSSLTEIRLPDSVEKVSDSAFYGSLIRKLYCNDEQYKSLKTVPALEKLLAIADPDQKNNETATKEKIVLSGTCGKGVDFELTDSGIIRLTGKGKTYNYHSLKAAPWSKYKNEIKEVEIGEGITSIGNQLFCKCPNLEKVYLPESLTSIECNVFTTCKKLTEIYIPKGTKSIMRYAFHGTGLKKIRYGGSAGDWKKIEIGQYNAPVKQCAMEYNCK